MSTPDHAAGLSGTEAAPVGTRIATAICGGSAEAAAAQLADAVEQQLGDAPPVLILAFASTQQPLSELLPGLRRRFPKATVLGASTAGEFTERGDQKGAVSLFALAGDYRVYAGCGTGLRADVESAVTQAAAQLPARVYGYPHRTALLLLDPLAGRSEEATLILSALLGEDVPVAGGAAGDDLHLKATHVGLNEQVLSDGLVVAEIFSKAPLGVGVCHAHRPLSSPLLVTRAEGSLVHEIEGRPAWDVWIEHTREHARHSGIDVDGLGAAASGSEGTQAVGAFLLRYEAGLLTGSALKLRAPLSKLEAGALGFACGIPTGTVIRIAESDPESQLASTRLAAVRSRENLGGREPAGALVFDCICRNLILKDRFGAAVRSISEELGGVPIAGFETYGEIALEVGDMSGFHNTTSVVLSFPR
ncbi:MAG: FIST N-terminal domain-containing protein [Polyangia bacterium]